MSELDEKDTAYRPRRLAERDRHHDAQLLRDLAIVNARTKAELGPLPAGGLPIEPKRKPKPWQPDTPAGQEMEDEAMKRSNTAVLVALSVAGALGACGADGTLAQPQEAVSKLRQGSSDVVSDDDLGAFLPERATILSSATGDLNRDGRMDAVIVADPGRTGKEFAGEGPSRIVMLLIRGEDGQLHEAKQSGKLIPCEKCGGMAGDPFGYVQIRNGTFTAVIEGGSPSVHWSEVYEFDYNDDIKDWVLRQIEHGVSDKIGNQSEQKIFTRSELKEISFENFDRSKLPHPISLLDQKDSKNGN